MIRRLLLLSVASFLLFSSFSSGQQSTDQYTTGNVLDPSTIEGTYNYCVPGQNCWSGETGGSVPNWSSSLGWSAYWGWGGGILKWTSAINTALEAAGMQIDGYSYQWRVKNKDTNAAQDDGDDYMRISVRIYDSAGNEVWGKQYNLDGYYDWSYFRGTEFFDESLKAEDLSNVIIRAEGDDPGLWAGYYGPEFNVADSYVRFIYSEIPDPCNDVPVVDPNCENFIGAAPQEDPAIKQLVIIESTGSIPLSEDELAVLESLEEASDAENAIPEPEPVEVEELEDEKNKVDALAVARNAEANALSDTANTIENTLAATTFSLEQDAMQSNKINQQAQEQSQQSLSEAESAQLTSIELSTDLNNLITENTNENTSPSQSQEQNVDASTNQQANDTNEESANDVVLSELSQSQTEPMIELEITVDTFEIAALDNAINDAVMNLIKLEQSVVREQVEESQQEEELTEPVSNDKEDELVAAALGGNDDEDAQAALLGFNPNFRAYQQPQMADAGFYEPKDIYPGQENYDNPAARFFNGASDATHRQMIRQQYERE